MVISLVEPRVWRRKEMPNNLHDGLPQFSAPFFPSNLMSTFSMAIFSPEIENCDCQGMS